MERITITTDKLLEVLTVMLHGTLKEDTNANEIKQAEYIVEAIKDMAYSGDSDGQITID